MIKDGVINCGDGIIASEIEIGNTISGMGDVLSDLNFTELKVIICDPKTEMIGNAKGIVEIRDGEHIDFSELKIGNTVDGMGSSYMCKIGKMFLNSKTKKLIVADPEKELLAIKNELLEINNE
jgi:hypothetical protein